MLEFQNKQWHRDGFLVSTAADLLDAEAINAAFGSDLCYWASSMSSNEMRLMLHNSLNFGLYVLPETTAQIAGRANPTQVGYARLVTDCSTFAYLTDVYVLAEHQGKGLGQWLIECVQTTLESWPRLRRMVLLTSSERSIKFYKERMNATVFNQENSVGLVIMNSTGRGAVYDASLTGKQ